MQVAAIAAVAAVVGVTAFLARALAKLHARTREDLAALASERRGLEAELQQHAERERMLTSAVELTKSPIIITTIEGIITAWNSAAELLYGQSAAEAIGQSVDIIIPEDRRDEYRAALDRVRARLHVKAFETLRVAKDGRSVDVSVTVSPITSATGEIIGISKITRDISAQKFAEEKFHLAVESCPSGMVMVDRTGKIVMVNTEVERLFGYSRDDLMGQRVDMLVPERLRGHHTRHREGFGREPQARRMGAGRDLFGLRKDGTEFPVEVGLNPIHTREGLLVLSVIVDISQRKQMERLKEEFVSTVSHELRTPLTSIAGSLGLLVGGAAGKLPDQAMRLLTIAQTNSQRLVRLINDILDIEKMESGQIVFNFKRLDMRSLVEQAIDANRGFADGYGVRVRFDAASVTRIVHADPDRLSQVVTNLLSNAVECRPRAPKSWTPSSTAAAAFACRCATTSPESPLNSSRASSRNSPRPTPAMHGRRAAPASASASSSRSSRASTARWDSRRSGRRAPSFTSTCQAGSGGGSRARPRRRRERHPAPAVRRRSRHRDRSARRIAAVRVQNGFLPCRG